MPNGRWAGSARRERLPADWPSICKTVRETYGESCYLCEHPHVTDVDHIHPGDDHSLANLRPICGAKCAQCKAEQRTPCHVAKSSREGGQAAQAARPKRNRSPERHPGLR